MNERHPDDLALKLEVDEVCRRFEKAWHTPERWPRLEDYLAGVTASARVEALRELLALELIYRQRLGDTFALDGYEQRFPADLPVIHSVFSAVVVTMPGAAVNGGPAASPGKSDVFIPGYEVLGELGRGGMGIVYMARQVKPNRIVALKKIKTGADAAAAELTRFRTEAEAVARLQHPNIVQIFEVGEHNGLPFFSLEFCGGGSLKAKLAGTPLPAAEAARLVATLARAVQAAHGQKVIHRDLNPANVLLAEDGTPKITDFGLAKKLDDVGGTVTGAIMGTPSYMAPEQARGQTQEVGPAADVYALGAILYECLTGHPPFKAATAHETLVQVVADDPVPPRQLQPKTPRDLETICLKCLQKEPGRRYASALDLAEDLQRFAAGEPIRARPVGRGERVLKWARRRPAAAGLAVATMLLVLALVGGVVGLFYHGAVEEALVEARTQRGQAESARDEARTEKEKAEKARSEEGKQRRTAEEQREKARKAEEEADRQRLRAEKQHYYARVQQALLAWKYESVPEAQNLLDQCRWDLRGWEYDYVQRLCIGSKLTLKGHASGVTSVAFSPDGARLASSGDRTVKVWDAQSGQEVLALKGHTSHVNSVAFSPDGKRLASGSEDKTVKVWDAQSGQEVLTLKGHTDGVRSVAFSPDGKRLASASNFPDRTVKVWDAQTGQEVLALKGHRYWVTSVAFSPDGKRLASGSWDSTVKVWDAQTGKEVLALKGHTDGMHSVAFSPDGKRLASGSEDKTVKVWDAQTGREVLALKGHTDGVRSVAFSPDGTRLASGGGRADQPGEVKVWDAQTGREVLALKGHTGEVNSVAFSPDGKRLASGSGNVFKGEAKVWDAQTGPEALTLQGHTGTVRSVAFSPDGKRLASGSFDKTVKVWDAQTGQEVLALQGHTGEVSSVAFSPDGKRLASGSDDKTVKVWDAQTGQQVLALKGHTDTVNSVAFSPDGTCLASGAGDPTNHKPGEVKVWDAQTGQEVLALKGHTQVVTSVCFSPDGKRIASGSYDQTVKVWDAQTGQEILTLKGHTYYVTGVAFSPDGTRLASAGSFLDRTVKVWDAQTGQQLLELKGHTQEVSSVAFSPDGKRIASASGWPENQVKVWDAQTGQEVLALKGHTQEVNSVAFSPEGKRLASASGWPENQVKVWDAQPGQEVLALKGHTRVVTSVCFSPDGKRIASAGLDQTVRVWDAQTGQELLALKGHTQEVNSVAFGPDGKRVIAASAKGEVRCWNANTGQEIVPCTDPPPPKQQQAASADGQRLVRIVNGQPVVGPRVLPAADGFNQGRQDQADTHFYHLRMVQEARQGNDAFALAFHLGPLLRSAFTRWQDRPHDSFPYWAWRPPLTRGPTGLPGGDVAVSESELRRLDESLSRQLQAEPRAWEAWAARGWCRHLLGDTPAAVADLQSALKHRPQEPGLWAVLGAVSVGRQPEQAEAARVKLAGWPGLDLRLWHRLEVAACRAEGNAAGEHWHLGYWLRGQEAPAAADLVRRGELGLGLGRDREAAADLARALERNATSVVALWWSARAHLAGGDREGYQRDCAALLKHFDAQKDPRNATVVARTVLLAPEAIPDVSVALRLLPAEQDSFTRTTRGGLLLRAGKHAEASAELEKAVAQRGAGGAPVSELLLAVAYHKQGKAEAAKRALATARFVLEGETPLGQALLVFSGGASGPLTAAAAATVPLSPPRWDWQTRLEIRLLRREAEALLAAK
jgi:WD40 repeat protein/tetratricopeptide (TPR) repeat protein